MSAPKNLGTAAGSKSWKSEDGAVEFVSTELLFCDATDLLADMMAAMGPAGGAWQAGTGGTPQARMAVRGEAVAMLAREVSAGRLTSYLVRVLAGTTMIVRGDGAGNYDLKNREALNRAFTGRQRYAFPAVKLALEVNFQGFLDGLGLIGVDMSKLTTKDSPSEDSSPSTSATG